MTDDLNLRPDGAVAADPDPEAQDEREPADPDSMFYSVVRSSIGSGWDFAGMDSRYKKRY